mmetsp:Transcript_8931/g.19059  ORF Transcript_8931/g.19059 Transcript_8931/m.19059 type:complete len:216 (+) Transcript_8931:437-1084(+)
MLPTCRCLQVGSYLILINWSCVLHVSCIHSAQIIQTYEDDSCGARSLSATDTACCILHVSACPFTNSNGRVCTCLLYCLVRCLVTCLVLLPAAPPVLPAARLVVQHVVLPGAQPAALHITGPPSGLPLGALVLPGYLVVLRHGPRLVHSLHRLPLALRVLPLEADEVDLTEVRPKAAREVEVNGVDAVELGNLCGILHHAAHILLQVPLLNCWNR